MQDMRSRKVKAWRKCEKGGRISLVHGSGQRFHHHQVQLNQNVVLHFLVIVRSG